MRIVDCSGAALWRVRSARVRYHFHFSSQVGGTEVLTLSGSSARDAATASSSGATGGASTGALRRLLDVVLRQLDGKLEDSACIRVGQLLLAAMGAFGDQVRGNTRALVCEW